MASFTDTQERVWTININIGVAMKVKRETDIDLLSALKNPESANALMVKLAGDPESLGMVIYAAAAPSVDGLTADDLFCALDHETAENAFFALDEAITDFFPPQVRGRLKKAKQRMVNAMKAEQDKALAEFDDKMASPNLETEILDAIRGSSSSE